MRTQAKPFIVQVRKRKRRGAGDSRPASDLLGLAAESTKLADRSPQARAADGAFARASQRGSSDQPGHDRADARPAAGWSAWPPPSDGATIASGAARVLPDLSQRDRVETVEAAKQAPRIRRKRRAATKPTEAASRAIDVGQSKADLPSAAPATQVTDIGDTSGGPQKRTRRPRLKWSAWRARRGKTEARTPVTRLGQRWKRRLPKTSR